MTRRDVITLLIGFSTLAALGLYSLRNLRISNDLAHFVPGSEDRQLAEISRRMAESPAARTMILSIAGPDTGQSVAGAKALASVLRSSPEVARCESGPDPRFAEAAFSLLFPHRFQLFSDRPELELPRLLSDGGLSSAAARLKAQLELPTAALVKRTAGSDPLLTFPAIVRRLMRMTAGSLAVQDGQFVTPDGQHAIIFLETRDSAFNGAAQMPFLDFVRRSFDEVNAARGGRLKLEQSGINRFAVSSERIVRNDVNRISAVSTVAIVLMFLVLFQSIRAVLLSLLPLISGLIGATAASIAIFGEVQALTLALGATLIGVCVDYPIYYLNHQALLGNGEDPRRNLLQVRRAITLGAFTTIAGFAGLAWTSFPGMRELAVFATAGILAALAATCWLLPALSARRPKHVRLHHWLAENLGGALEAAAGRRLFYAGLVVAASAVCALGLPRIQWNDDPKSLNRLDGRLLAEDERVRAEVSRMDADRFILVTGVNEREAMARNDRLYEQLVAAKAAGEVEDFASLHPLLFSPDLQERNLAAFRSSRELGPRLQAAFAGQGFRAEALAAFGPSLAAPVAPLQLKAVLASPLGDIVRPFTVQLDHGLGLISLVRGATSEAALQRRIESVPGAHYFDQSAFLSHAYERYRTRTLELLAVGLLLMLALVYASFGSLRMTAGVALPALIAAPTTLAVLALAGVVLNLLHVIALVLVLSAGEDYAIFLVAGSKSSAELRSSAVSVALACLATALGFGLLGFSEIPALRALGLTTGIGLLLSVILAPLALVVASPRRG